GEEIGEEFKRWICNKREESSLSSYSITAGGGEEGMSCGGATGAAVCLSMTFSLVLEFNSKARKNAAAAGKEEAIACGALDTAAGRTEEMVFNGVAAELEMEMEADEGD